MTWLETNPSAEKKKGVEKMQRVSLKLWSWILSWDFPKNVKTTRCSGGTEGCDGS